jgi:hypothetical protein
MITSVVSASSFYYHHHHNLRFERQVFATVASACLSDYESTNHWLVQSTDGVGAAAKESTRLRLNAVGAANQAPYFLSQGWTLPSHYYVSLAFATISENLEIVA